MIPLLIEETWKMNTKAWNESLKTNINKKLIDFGCTMDQISAFWNVRSGFRKPLENAGNEDVVVMERGHVFRAIMKTLGIKKAKNKGVRAQT